MAGELARLREAVSGLGPAQLDTPHRDGGWTARQIVHHIPDSHVNGYVRFALKARPGGGPRWGNGVRLTYFAADERYVLSGPRATVVERIDGQQCRETTGRTLTFFTSTDSVVVDSDNNSRTLTQTGTTCQEPTP